MSDVRDPRFDQPAPTPTDEPYVQHLVLDDVRARLEMGIKKYGTGLQASNGRDMLQDAYEEVLDLAIYLRGELEKRRIPDLNLALSDATSRVVQVNRANGWMESERTFGEDIALLHSEVSEALEAFRSWAMLDATEMVCTKHPELAHRTDECKPEGVGSEMADVFIRLLDTCWRFGIDLGKEFERKLAYNATRGHRHGGKNL